jgi:hypothetical protein
MGWMVLGSNLGIGEIFWFHPDWPEDPPSLLYNRYQVSFLGVKRLGCGTDHPTVSGVGVQNG